jgi:hypothetical protein
MTMMRNGRLHLFYRDERGALGGFVPDMVAGILAAYGLVIITAIFGVLLKAFVVSVMTINFAHAYSMTQLGIDPATNVSYGTEAAQSFATILPVTNSTSDVVSTPPTIGQEATSGDLALFLGPDPSNGGFDRLTVDYALQLPISIPTWNGTAWTSVTPAPIQLFYSLDFYQEW